MTEEQLRTARTQSQEGFEGSAKVRAPLRTPPPQPPLPACPSQTSLSAIRDSFVFNVGLSALWWEAGEEDGWAEPGQ